MKKWIAAAAVLVAIFCFWYYQNSKKPENEYLTTIVKKGNLTQSVEAVGEVFAENLVDVGAQVSGQIKELYVKVGDKVKKGDKIAQIDSIKQQNTLDQQLAALEILNAKLKSAKISLNIAEIQYNRELRLAEQNATSVENLENYKNTLSLQNASLKEIEAQIKQTQIEISTARTNLNYTDIRAPFDGVVVSVPVEVGQTLNANQTTPTLVNIADLSKMEIRMQISEGDVPKISIGDRVEYSILSDINKKYTGSLTSIDPGLTTLSDGKYKTTSSSSGSSSSSSSSAVYYYAKLKVDNSSEFLRIGMTTQNTIIIKEIKDTLLLPTMAIKSDENGNFVLIKNGEEIKKVRVEVGISSSVDTQILSGLSEGDEVVTSQLGGDELKKLLNTRSPKIRV
ncbi:efflux RND transporter periplasmic adaptor subunit [Campylobacter fetus]|uniref:efflux RND transporter periplasmic adaptor subunit n=1 Tax=Campylobacter fetus TaxID=196 RepID=UPI000FCC41E4|nr:efflux RND transporter periplasmic adaptor subunit [Campylobacter fetus]QQF51567.1 efflux RND transporter periplasmic adaptor subunit [Campylobacter fetus subsp. venerealis]